MSRIAQVLLIAGSITHGAPIDHDHTSLVPESHLVHSAEITELLSRGAQQDKNGVIIAHNVTAQAVTTICSPARNCGGSGQQPCTGCCLMSSCKYNDFLRRYENCQSCSCNYYCMRKYDDSGPNGRHWAEPPSSGGCCWNRNIQSCRVHRECAAYGEGCIAPGTNTHQYGRANCNTCEKQGMVYDAPNYRCIPTPSSTPSSVAGLKYVKSHRSKYLEDRHGTVQLMPDSQGKGGWQQWTLEDAGSGLYYIKSHRGKYLEDRDGTVQLMPDSQSKGGWQQWYLESA